MCNIKGKTALITGATGGIGEAIARKFHANGANVVLTGRRQEKLDEIANDLKERVYTLQCDLSNTEDTNSLFDKAEELASQVDILICNAGITKDNLTLRMSDEDFQTVINTNLFSAFKLNKTAFKKMMKRKWGRVINITSVVGVSGNPGQANYAASKAGMIGMTKSIAIEAAPRGITYNCIAPGFIETPMTDKLNDNQKEQITKNIPCGKLGQSDDIANAAFFLASEEASYITGQTLHVNGGMLMV